MKTAKVDGQKKKITFRTDSGMYTRMSKCPHVNAGQYGAEVYDVDGDDDHIVIVASTAGRGELRGTTTVITSERYNEIANLYQPDNGMPYHFALMRELGFE